MTSPRKTPHEVAVLGAVATIEPWSEYPATDEQRAIKAKFWIAFKQNPIIDEKDVNAALVQEFTGHSIAGWMSDPAFWRWFSSKDSTKHIIEVAAEKAAELASFYLNPAVPFNDNARVQLIKYMLEFSGRSPPSRKEIKWQDKEIADLTSEQLDALIQKQLEKPKK